MMRAPDARNLGISAAVGDPVLQALFFAPIDEEPDTEDFDGGLSQARREAREGRTIPHEEVKMLLLSIEEELS